MTIPSFDEKRFPDETVIARLGDGPVDDAIEHLNDLNDALSASTLAEEFSKVEFAVSPTLVLTGEPTSEELAAITHTFETPLRLRCTDREIVLANAASDIAARAAAIEVAVSACLADGPAPVIVQSTIGSAHGDRYYPNISGVLLTENYYPISYMKPEEGIAYVALGLGVGNRSSMGALRFSPTYPDLMPDFSTPQDILKNSQRKLVAVDLTGDAGDPLGAAIELDLEAAFADGTLAPVGGVVSLENQTVYPSVHREGIKVVTFSQLLRGGVFPLAKVVKGLHEVVRRISPDPTSVEFAVNLKDPKDREGKHLFVVERVTRRPAGDTGRTIDLGDLDAIKPKVICASTAALGNGDFPGVRDLICVCPDRLDIARSPEIAHEVGEFNRKLREERKPYVLIGSGRWGTTDKSLGVPITWEQVSGARIQIEAGLEEFNIESSRGTHFFRELTFHEVGYMHISLQKPGDAIDWEWLQNAETVAQGEFVRHLSFNEPLRIRIDGRTGSGAILNPGTE